LSQALTSEALVIRDGKKYRIPAKELTLGDLVLLVSGNKVPADLRLISANNLQVDEFALTGESLLVSKNVKSLNESTSLPQRTNIAYAGSFVMFGQGSGIVIDIGNNTQLGLLSKSTSARFSLETPLTCKLIKFSKILTYTILSLASFTFIWGIGLGRPWGEMLNAAVALSVSAIPYSLPLVITLTLGIGIERMVRRHIIIRKLPALESLLSATVICTDKTGILTENQITVQLIYAGKQQYTLGGIGYNPKGTVWLSGNLQPVHFDDPSHIALKECLVAGLLCNDSHLRPRGNQWTVVGDSTDGALVVSARKAGLSQSKHREAMPRLNTIPFDSKYQYMATLHSRGDNVCNELINNVSIHNIIYIKGSVEAILSRSEQMLDNNGNLIPLDRASIEQEVEIMAKQGLRVLAFAKKFVENHCNFINHENLASGHIFLGLQLMIDPFKQEVFAAIKSCYSAGIQVKMITGEYITTAVANAYKLGLARNAKIDAFEGQELLFMNNAAIEDAVKTGVVFGRVTPDQKLLIVKALQEKGEIVAVTGSGVNDVPVLKQSDIGIAMGKAGTDFSKETADMVLMDDNFASIKAAYEEGRSVYHNLHKAIAFILPVSSSESLTVFIAVLMGLQLPILPIQILWLNIINVIMAVAFAFTPKSSYLTKKSPRNWSEALLSKRLLWCIWLVSTFNWIVIFGMFEWAYRIFSDVTIARTMAIQALVLIRIVYMLTTSHWGKSITPIAQGQEAPSDVSVITLAIFASIILQILFSQWGVMNTLLATAPLNLTQLFICCIPLLLMIPIAIIANNLNSIQ
jgi:Ca2+-transporting ATPase